MRLLCLANSYKEGGRCIAGILLNNNNLPILRDNKAVWIRPVCKAEHGQVPNSLCNNILPLDIIEINGTNNVGSGYQSENTSFDENEILSIGRVNKNILNNLYSGTNLIFGNRGKAIPKDTIKTLDHSLILVNLTEFEIIEKEYKDRQYPQVRLNFTYNNNSYDLPVTDPIFLNNYNNNNTILNNKNDIDVVLSLGVPFNNWYYKLVATIIY